jgi:GNAT superfamily N-acetyltransferase
VIRAATPADVADLRRLMAGSNGYEPGPQQEMIRGYAAGWTLEPDADVWVLQDDRGVAGFYQLIPYGEADLELDLFFTADDRQGAGHGRRLFDHMAARARARGAGRVLIVSNPAAAGFYRRMGAAETGVSPPGQGISWPRPQFELRLSGPG